MGSFIPPILESGNPLLQFLGFPDTFSKFPAVWWKSTGDKEMKNGKNKKKVLAVMMESPYYHTVPPKRRKEFLNFFSIQSVFNLICKHNKQLIKP